MTGYRTTNLLRMIKNAGEESVKDVLNGYECPENPDVEHFLKYQALEFAKQGLSQTHLVLASYEQIPVLVGYFTLANKHLAISASNLSNTLKKRIAEFSSGNCIYGTYNLAIPLIAQLGKNFANNYNTLIRGEELLGMALNKIQEVQLNLGGRFIYVECENKPKLIEFYTRYGFNEFSKRSLDKNEREDLHGEYLVS